MVSLDLTRENKIKISLILADRKKEMLKKEKSLQRDKELMVVFILRGFGLWLVQEATDFSYR